MITTPEAAKSLLVGLHRLPARSQTHYQVLRVLDSAVASTAEIASKINQDVALTAHILKMANSVLFSPGGKVSSTSEAVALIGVLRLKTLVTTAWAFQLLDETKHVLGFEAKAEWDHALQVGAISQGLAKEISCTQETTEETFSAALLHDLGKILIAANAPEIYAAISEETNERSLPRWQIEQELMGFNHADIGASVLETWGMAPILVDAVKWHHQPTSEARNKITPLTLVHLADCKARNIQPDAACLGRYCVAQMVAQRNSTL